MKKITYILLPLLFVSLMGCGSQLRQTALAAHDLADRLNHETVDDLYAMTVKERMALTKVQLKAAKDAGTLDEPVTYTYEGPDGQIKTMTASRLDYIVNVSSQTLVDAGWLYNNHTKAQHYSDVAWIYIASRESFLELLVRDIREAWKKAKENDTPDTPVVPDPSP